MARFSIAINGWFIYTLLEKLRIHFDGGHPAKCVGQTRLPRGQDWSPANCGREASRPQVVL